LLRALRFDESSKEQRAKCFAPGGMPDTVNDSAVPGAFGSGSPARFAAIHQLHTLASSLAAQALRNAS